MKRKLLLAAAAALLLFCAVFGAACGNRVTLSFECNGGAPLQSFTADVGGELSLPTPTKEGFVFDGWYTDAAFTGTRYEGTVTAPEGNVTYYAKWAQGYEVTLDTDGGVLSEQSVLLKEGDALLDAVKGLVPVKSGLTFGAWFLGENELQSSYRMPAAPVTLKAKYKVEYIIEAYLQNVRRTAYQRDDTKESAGSGYVGAEVTPLPPEIEHFTYRDDPEGKVPVKTRTLSENADENVFSLYYDRMVYTLYYDSNVPAGESVTGATQLSQAVYGDSMAAASNGFVREGYRFAGWATSEQGVIAYYPGDQVLMTEDIFLYALWDKGYADRFGSEDLLFFPRDNSALAVLRRNGVEFSGTREGNTFSFTTKAGEQFGGAVLGNTFCYEMQNVKGDYVYYDNYPRPADTGDEGEESRYDRTRTLSVDEYLNATYTEQGSPVHGALEFFADQGDYLFTGDDGTTFHTVFQKSESGNIFSISGEEFGYYVDNYGEVLLLDGYGTAFLNITLSSGYNVTLSGNYYIEGEARLWDSYDTYKIVCWINDPSGILNDTAGWQEYSVCAVPNYWATLGTGYGYYLFADTSRGSYDDGQGGTLVLDGHGYYADSAVYTAADGTVIQGPYGVTSDFVSGSVVSIGEDADHIIKQFRLSSDGSFREYNGPEVDYTEYYLVEGTAMQPVLLAIFEEEAEGVPGSLRAEFYTRNSRGVAVHAGSGYVLSKPAAEGASILLYTFTRTNFEYGFDTTIPQTMTFVTTTVETSGSVRYSAYCILERDGEKLYQVISLPDGGSVWANGSVEIDGEGSLYFRGGAVYHCSFPTYRDEYFGAFYGELLYYDGTQSVNRLYTLTPSSQQGIDYTASPAVGLPGEFYYFDPELSPTNGVYLNLVLTPTGEAAFDDTGTGEYFAEGKGRYEDTGETTRFREPIYRLMIGGTERMRFTLAPINFLGYTYNGYFPYVGFEGDYETEDGGILYTDGYGSARYTSGGTVLEGSYYFVTGTPESTGTLAGTILRLTDAEGTEHEFEFEGEDKVTALDSIYGSWDLVDGNFHPLNNYARIFFNGKGTYTITPEHGTSASSVSGYYVLSDAEYGEFLLLNVTINGVRDNYRVRFMEYAEYNNYNCVVQDRANGVFVDDHYNVLSLNGFGSGTLMGNSYNSAGNYYNIDEEAGFGYFLFTTVNTGYADEIIHVLLDLDAGTFQILTYENYLYVASDLDHIAFRDDGSVFIGNMRSGDYFITEKGVQAYFYDQYEYRYEKVDMPSPGSGEYQFDGKTYYPYTAEQFTAEGTVKMLDATGETLAKEVDAKLSFAFLLRGVVSFPVTFEIGGTPYTGYLLSSYTLGKIDPRIEYNNIVYNIDFSRGAGGNWTFVVTDAGVRKFTRDDVNVSYYDGVTETGSEFHQGGRLQFTYNGFGPYLLEETVYSGRFLYFYQQSEVLEFDGVKESEIKTVGYHNLGSGFGGYHDLREILFNCNGKRYAFDFFEYTSGSVIYTYTYMLYGLYEYEEVEAGDFKLGVKYLRITTLSGSPGYGNEAAKGKPIAVTVLGGAGKDQPVVALSSGTRYGDKGVWMVESTEINGVKGYAGDAYLITFHYGDDGRVQSGSVQIGSVQTVGLSASYYFYLFVDEEGEIGEIMVAWYAGVQFASVREISSEGNVWTFLGREDASSPEYRYTLTFRKGTSGNYTVTVDRSLVQ